MLTAPDDFSAVREALEQAGVPMVEADVTMLPQTWVELSDEPDIKLMGCILDLLDEDDDVQNVSHNPALIRTDHRFRKGCYGSLFLCTRSFS